MKVVTKEELQEENPLSRNETGGETFGIHTRLCEQAYRLLENSFIL
jgi:hypothetical protein